MSIERVKTAGHSMVLTKNTRQADYGNRTLRLERLLCCLICTDKKKKKRKRKKKKKKRKKKRNNNNNNLIHIHSNFLITSFFFNFLKEMPHDKQCAVLSSGSILSVMMAT